jgi:hypothetical protein
VTCAIDQTGLADAAFAVGDGAVDRQQAGSTIAMSAKRRS